MNPVYLIVFVFVIIGLTWLTHRLYYNRPKR
jgi:hypothetical protein